VCRAASLPQRESRDFYRADLIGCEAVNLDGISLGKVQHFIESPAQVLMVVRGTREYWIPPCRSIYGGWILPARRVSWTGARRKAPLRVPPIEACALPS